MNGCDDLRFEIHQPINRVYKVKAKDADDALRQCLDAEKRKQLEIARESYGFPEVRLIEESKV